MSIVLTGCTQIAQTATITYEQDYTVDPVLAPPTTDDLAATPTAEGVRAAIETLLADPALRGTLGVAVHDATTDEQLFASNETIALTPASTTKIVTAAAILAAVGPDHRIPTRVVAGANPGEVVIVGGGDPTLSIDGEGYYPGAASLTELAEQVETALGGEPVTTVYYDSSLFTGPGLAEGVANGDVKAGWTANATALMTDGARIDPDPGSAISGKRHDAATPRYAEPDAAAANAFAKLFGAATVVPGTAADGAEELGVVHSPPVRRLVEETVLASDNIVADVLIRHVAIARGLPGTNADANTAVRELFGELGLPADQMLLNDGSGMSADNKISAGVLSQMLALAAGGEHPELTPLFAGLPVAGYTGTLDDRYGKGYGEAARGLVRAKTGTLSGVSSLAGVVLSADGTELSFALLVNDRGNQLEAEAALDVVASALAGCGCA